MLSITILFSFVLTSCLIKRNAKKLSTDNIEKISLDFEIVSDEISFEAINEIDSFKNKLIAYSNFEIIATLKQINKTSRSVKLDDFIVYENFEITNTKREKKDDLITEYHYSIIMDPETYETIGVEDIMLKPNEYSIDSINLVKDFRFYLSDPDTLLIRIKKVYFEKEIYSNCDTLIIK